MEETDLAKLRTSPTSYGNLYWNTETQSFIDMMPFPKTLDDLMSLNDLRIRMPNECLKNTILDDTSFTSERALIRRRRREGDPKYTEGIHPLPRDLVYGCFGNLSDKSDNRNPSNCKNGTAFPMRDSDIMTIDVYHNTLTKDKIVGFKVTYRNGRTDEWGAVTNAHDVLTVNTEHTANRVFGVSVDAHTGPLTGIKLCINVNVVHATDPRTLTTDNLFALSSGVVGNSTLIILGKNGYFVTKFDLNSEPGHIIAIMGRR